MKNNINITYGYQDGKLVHISSVKKGLDCNCTCKNCGERLIAKKGGSRAHHFAHESGNECANAAETVLHILAKKIISELSFISLPSYNYKKTKSLNGVCITHEQELIKSHNASIQAVNIEPHYESYRPDTEVFTKAGTLIIEIAVTHKVDDKKLRLLRQEGLQVIEIRFSKEDAQLNQDELRKLIQLDTHKKHWLCHPKDIEADLLFDKKYQSAKKSHRKKSSSLPSFRKATYANKGLSQTVSWQYSDEIGERFKKEHGRYPSHQEIQKLIP